MKKLFAVFVVILATCLLFGCSDNNDSLLVKENSIYVRGNRQGQVFVGFELNNEFNFGKVDSADEGYLAAYMAALPEIFSENQNNRSTAGIVIKNDIIIRIYTVKGGEKTLQKDKNKFWSGYLNEKGTSDKNFYGPSGTTNSELVLSPNKVIETSSGSLYSMDTVPDSVYAEIAFVNDGKVILHKVSGEIS